MQKLLTKYGLALQIGILVVVTCWSSLIPERTIRFIPLFWLSLLAMETGFLLPTVHSDETFSDARERFVRTLVRDPFFYLSAAFVMITLVQWLNSGCPLVYAPLSNAWRFASPSLPWAPFAIKTDEAFRTLALSTTCAGGCLLLRHAMGRSAKRVLLHVSAVAVGGFAVYAVAQACWRVSPYAAYALGKGGGEWGLFFGFWALVGMGVFFDGLARGERRVEALYLFGVFGNVLGLLFFSNALFCAVYSVLIVVIFVYGLVYLRGYVMRAVQLKLVMLSFVVVACMVVGLIFVFPSNPVVAKLKLLADWPAYWSGWMASKQVRTSAAFAMWQDHPWIGVGVDGFRHFSGFSVEDKAWHLIRLNPDCVYNDSLQFLCEYGLLGFGLMTASGLALGVSLLYRLGRIWQGREAGNDEHRSWVFRLSPVVVTATLAVTFGYAASWFSSPFRVPALLLSWTIVLAALPAFIPVRAQS